MPVAFANRSSVDKQGAEKQSLFHGRQQTGLLDEIHGARALAATLRWRSADPSDERSERRAERHPLLPGSAIFPVDRHYDEVRPYDASTRAAASLLPRSNAMTSSSSRESIRGLS